MAKQLIFQAEARHRLKVGMDKMAQAVATTLGPKGRNIALDYLSNPTFCRLRPGLSTNSQDGP